MDANGKCINAKTIISLLLSGAYGLSNNGNCYFLSLLITFFFSSKLPMFWVYIYQFYRMKFSDLDL